jgi:hypothetical protein
VSNSHTRATKVKLQGMPAQRKLRFATEWRSAGAAGASTNAEGTSCTCPSPSA